MTTNNDDRTNRVLAAVEAVRAGVSVTAAASNAGVQWMEVRAVCSLLGVCTSRRGQKAGELMARRRTSLAAGQRRVSVQLTHLGNPEMVRVDYSVPEVITIRADDGEAG